MSNCFETDVLVIGSGIAGGVAALQLADAGIEVTVITRVTELTESNTYYAQGGIVYRGKDDSPELLSEDIKLAGAGYCSPEAVRVLAEQGPGLVREMLMDRIGVNFDRDQDGALSLANEGAHSIPRILHSTDATGKAIENALVRALVKHPKIKLLTGHTAVDILTPAHHSTNRLAVYEPQSCVGAYLLSREDEQVTRCIAKKTILATGGLGQIFLRTTNPPGARGDGLAMASRAGARAINNEFIQFHPTIFFHRNAPMSLISEAVRGAGARLVNVNGEPFMQKYDPKWKDLAPRDVVSRSIHQEMLINDVPNVYLDLRSYISPRQIKIKFPNIYKNCLAYGVDITKDFVPVVPAAHYAIGGVWVDKSGLTTLDHFYAVGEVACTGLHGANRIASTSLLEGVVWGYRAAMHIKETLKDMQSPDRSMIPPWEDAGSENPDPALISQDMSYIKHIMWNYVGLVRTTHRLQRALRELRNLENEIERFYRVTKISDGLIGLRSAARAAIIVTAAAWANKRSMGCHYRE